MSETIEHDPNRYDLIVVGLGAMGAATLLHAQRLGLRVLGIDRYDPPHDLGSSHAETRITRLAAGEGEQYLPFVARSHEIWRELERETGESLFFQSGGYIITKQDPTDERRWNDFVTATEAVSAASGIPFERVPLDDVRNTHPSILVADDDSVGYEPTSGVVMSERAVAVQLRLAREAGVEARVNEAVTAVEPDADGVTVATTAGSYRAVNVVLSAGPWMPELTGAADGENLAVTRQVVFWFEVEDPDAFSVDSFPTILWPGHSIEDYVGVFPIPPGGTSALKIMGEQFSEETDPDSVNREVTQTEIDEFYERLIAPRLAGVTPNCVRATVCLYTNTPDEHFLIDTDPSSDRILLMSPCSGHGFKHSTALGEAVAQRIATGQSDLDLTPFKRRWVATGV